MDKTVHAMKEASPDVFALHVDDEGEGVDASAVVQQFYPNLFRVMRIVSDKQDYSFVEKIQLPQDDVLSLCNNLAPSSASAYSGEPPGLRINFNALNQRCLRVVGFYGDKNMIVRTFRKESLVDESVLAKMEGGLLEAGLYVSLPDKISCAVVFYWHEGGRLKQASRKDVSCNFVRYLVELCHSVYVFVDGSYPFEALASSATSSTSKTKRTRRIQISSVKSSENDVELLPGYNIRIDGGEKSKKSSAEPSANVHSASKYNNSREEDSKKDPPIFCEGYHNCCLLTAEERSVARTSTKTEHLSVKPSAFCSMLETWSSESNVDYSRLSNAQFIDFLKNCQPHGFEIPTEPDLVEKLKKKMSVLQEDNLVTRYVEEVVIQRPSRNVVQRTLGLRSSQAEQVELKVKISIAEKHPFNIVYKACELTPMKKDISKVDNNSTSPIIPTCGDPVELVAINPKKERLYKAVFLKSGDLIVFVHDSCDSTLYLYLLKIGAKINKLDHPIHPFKRGFDLVAVDEVTRCIALYGKANSKILVYMFEKSFRKVFKSDTDDINLEMFEGSRNIVWMHLIPGKMELLLVDDTNRARVVDFRRKPMMKAKPILLRPQRHSLRACLSMDGYFFLVFRQLEHGSEDLDIGVKLDVYVLGDTMSHLKTIPLDAKEFSISNFEQFGAKFTRFRSQSQILLYSHVDGPGIIFSHVVKSSSTKEVVQLQQDHQTKAPEDETEITLTCPYLGYIYHIFDKFATSPKLFPDAKKRITFNVVLERNRSDNNNNEACLKYLNELIRQLKAGKDKDFSNMKIQFEMNNVENCTISVGARQQRQVKMGMWIRKLLCLVPVQIARAENGGVVALKDGLQIPPDVSYDDSVSLANSIRFGFYDAVLNSWKGKIKVISSMGKQSSGKSYLLNHLSGSLLDVAGGRCTDGVWMTIATDDDDGDCSGGSRCLYVLLDFEGLGSFERSEQEDMLLSVLNAAVSNLTIFNKKDFHLDKDTESSFNRFQSGINLLKEDKKLFKGLFYIAIKDVDKSDVDDLIDEFLQKIDQICSKSAENFISKMYDGKVDIVAMAPYNRAEYYRESLSELAETVTGRIDSCYGNGFNFLRDLKLIIAQVASRDWTSIDSKRIAVTVNNLKKNLEFAVHMGCLSFTSENEKLRVLENFDTEEEVPDIPVVIMDISCSIRDSGLSLSGFPESATHAPVRDILSQVRSEVETNLSRNGTDGGKWHSFCQKFLEALADRRRDRVQDWISSNTTDFCGSDEVQTLKLEANALLSEVRQRLAVCGCKCSSCFWRCVMVKGHDDKHDCMGSHQCTKNCTYCDQEGDMVISCTDLAGHEGDHDCKVKKHTCVERCYLYGMSLNCNQGCSARAGHQGQHKCNSPQHTCSKECRLPGCSNPCTEAAESSHEFHQCHERYCRTKCMIKGCTRTCGVEDHFHDLDRNAEHFCGDEHVCPEKCEMRGVCDISTGLVKETRNFQGQRGSFEYVLSEQTGRRNGCCIPIPRYKGNHEGPHVHTTKEDSVHYCDAKCQACGYFCQLEVDHSGLHKTAHGNMKNVTFISEGEDIDIEERKYKWGETGVAEMCNMFCKKQGRGHIHLVRCPGPVKCTGNIYDGARHETVKYGPDVNVPKDEMAHTRFWEYVGFEDPCMEEEREGFDQCNHYCKSEEHETESGTFDKIYCTEKLWHSAIQTTGQNVSSAGYISGDGHHFPCDHSENVPHHVIFIIDRSGSMDSTDIKPTLVKFNKHKCRLGCVYEAILRFIQTRLRTVSNDSVSVVLFCKKAAVALEMQDIKEGVVDSLLLFNTRKGTDYSSGLAAADDLLFKGIRHQSVHVKNPVVIFLSDGRNSGEQDPLFYVDKMKSTDPRMILHTIMFGKDPTKDILIEMAKKGGGTFEQTLDDIQLARSFESLAESLKPQVAALM